jgi:hypothetical protein
MFPSSSIPKGRRARACWPACLPMMAAWLIVLLALPAVVAPSLLFAGTKILNDPKGFQGLSWGSPLTEVPTLTLAESTDRVKGYDFQKGSPRLGPVSLEYMRFFTIDGKFARVTIRYRGEQNHEQVLEYLESQFGALDRTPGSMMRGLNQQFNWRGTETEVNLTYDGFRERGFLFIESRLFAPRFNEGYPEHAF